MPSPALTALAVATLRVPGSPERILEIECGDGDGVLFLAREYPAARVRGVDRSEEGVREAIGRIGLDPEGRVAFKRGTPRSLPFPDDHFDLVVQARGPLRPGEVARVMRPGSHLLAIGGWRWLDWRLRMHGFEPTESGAAEGTAFLLARCGDSG